MSLKQAIQAYLRPTSFKPLSYPCENSWQKSIARGSSKVWSPLSIANVSQSFPATKARNLVPLYLSTFQ